MQDSDVEDFLRVFDDPMVMASFDVPGFDRRNIGQWVQRNLTHQADHGYGLFSVLLRQSGKLIGNCGLTRMLIDGVLIVELGYEFNSKYWNQGYGPKQLLP